jgi:hypothetical protein
MADRPAAAAAPISAARSGTPERTPGDESSNATSSSGISCASAESVTRSRGSTWPASSAVRAAADGWTFLVASNCWPAGMRFLRSAASCASKAWCLIQVHVVPLEAEGFTLTKPKRQQHSLECAVASLTDYLQQASYLIDAARLDLFFRQLWRLWVGKEVADALRVRLVTDGLRRCGVTGAVRRGPSRSAVSRPRSSAARAPGPRAGAARSRQSRC